MPIFTSTGREVIKGAFCELHGVQVCARDAWDWRVHICAGEEECAGGLFQRKPPVPESRFAGGAKHPVGLASKQLAFGDSGRRIPQLEI